VTSKGKAFTAIVSWVHDFHGFGSTKTCTQYLRALDYVNDGYTKYDLEWLVKNGYLFHYQVERYDRKRNWRYKFRVDDIYGVTKKGWSVAHLYVRNIKQ